MERELTVEVDGATLAGSLWTPDGDPRATVVMHPGSGPADRHNDGYFTTIREHLLASGCAVAACDKRGVGGSTGRWEEAGIETQADDLLALLAHLTARPVGVFGHSQGGWVVLEAASRSQDIAFVVTNSGPGVTPGEQERFAAQRAGRAMERFERSITLAQQGITYSEVIERRDELEPFVPQDVGEWSFWCSIVDFDPVPALQRIHGPVLALFGEDDALVPVAASVAAFERGVAGGRSTVEVFRAADHRIQVNGTTDLAGGYLDTLTDFIARSTR